MIPAFFYLSFLVYVLIFCFFVFNCVIISNLHYFNHDLSCIVDLSIIDFLFVVLSWLEDFAKIKFEYECN